MFCFFPLQSAPKSYFTGNVYQIEDDLSAVARTKIITQPTVAQSWFKPVNMGRVALGCIIMRRQPSHLQPDELNFHIVTLMSDRAHRARGSRRVTLPLQHLLRSWYASSTFALCLVRCGPQDKKMAQPPEIYLRWLSRSKRKPSTKSSVNSKGTIWVPLKRNANELITHACAKHTAAGSAWRIARSALPRWPIRGTYEGVVLSDGKHSQNNGNK